MATQGAVAPITDRRLRTPRAAAIAGIVFALLLSLVLILISTPAKVGTTGAWLSDPGRRATLAVALDLIPYAGIAFLWFIGVVRDRIGAHEDRFFATVFLGSGLLFDAMLFAGAAVAGGLITERSGVPGLRLDGGTLALNREVISTLLRVYGMRMAGVFTLNTAVITLRTGIVARWISAAGIAVGVVLLVSIGLTPWLELLFPAWILLLSVEILRTGRRSVLGPAGAIENAPAGSD
jgi:hypothetical protein